MNRQKIILAVAVLLLGMVLFVGCSDKSDDVAQDEMVLYHVLGTKLKGLDPGNMRDVYSMVVGSQIFETLYQYHFLKRPYELEPQLAAEMPQVSDDLLTYTIKIKQGVYFQDDVCFEGGKGRELKADDFVYSIKRIATLRYASRNWTLFSDKIIGLDEFREYTKGKKESEVDYSRVVEGLQALDEYTIQIKLTQPWPQMLETAFADTATAPLAKEAVDHYGMDIISNPVGTGPYVLSKWRRGSYIELVRSDSFRGDTYPTEGADGDLEAGYLADAGKPIPFADKIVWTIIEESQPAWFLFLQGKLDASSIPKDNWGEAVTSNRDLTGEMKQRNIHLKTYITASTFWVGYNMQDPIIGKNKPLRQAISRAIDRQKFLDLFTNGRDTIAHGAVAPLMDSYDESIKEMGYSKYDPDEARRLVKEAEKVHGGPLPVLKIGMPGTGTFSKQYGTFVIRQLEAVGIKLEADFMDWPTYLGKLNTASMQLFASGSSASIPDAQDFLQMFYGPYKSPGSNSFNYQNPEFDKLYEKAVVMQQSPERTKLYRKLEKMAMEDCPATFMNHRVAYALHHDWYMNYKPHAFSYGLSKYRRIDLEKRNEYKKLVKTLK